MKTTELIQKKAFEGAVELHSVLQKRFSPRLFNDEPVSEEDMLRILQAARWTPSSFNSQPWFFYWALKGTPGFEKIFSVLDDGNQTWAGRAGALIVACYIPEGKKGPHKYAQYDLGQAMQSMVVEAMASGYYARQMGGFSPEKAREVLSIPVDRTPFSMMAIGRIGDYEKISGELEEKEMKERKRKEEFEKRV